MKKLIPPYRGDLVNLLVGADERSSLLTKAKGLRPLRLSHRALCDLELLATGALSPLTRFMGRADYESVLEGMRLADGTLWPIPITLSVGSEEDAHLGEDVCLVDARNEPLAVMTLEEVYPWDLATEAAALVGRADTRHPLVSEMLGWAPRYASGTLRVVTQPRHYDFIDLRLTPAAVRARLESMGHEAVVAFQTRNPLHRCHEELTKKAARDVSGALLLHPTIGLTKPGDIDAYTRVRIYRELVNAYYDPSATLLALIPLAMRMAGPREALWHAIVRRNYGASHFIVGRDHAGPGAVSSRGPFFAPYEAQGLVVAHAGETGVQPLTYGELVYLPREDRYEEIGRVPPGSPTLSISGTSVRDEYLAKGRTLPEWFTRPEAAKLLADAFPPRHRQGYCVWFTGLPAAGKSTLAEALTALLLERGREVTLLDGDIVRTHLSAGLGFSREDRDANVLRIAFVASEVVRHGGVAVCAAVSPYRATRDRCRAMIGADRFIEVFVDTPLEVCELRDTKGLYAKARRGEIRNVTGIDDPYEPPEAPVLALTSDDRVPEKNAEHVAALLAKRGLLRS